MTHASNDQIGSDGLASRATDSQESSTEAILGANLDTPGEGVFKGRMASHSEKKHAVACEELVAFRGKIVRRSKRGDFLHAIVLVEAFSEKCLARSDVLEVDGEMVVEQNPEQRHVRVIMRRRDESRDLSLASSLLVLGTRVFVEGKMVNPSGGELQAVNAPMTTIEMQNWEILRASADAGLKGIERILLASDIFGKEPISQMLGIRVEEVDALLRTSPDSEERKQAVIRINRKLKGLPEHRHRKRPPKLSENDFKLLARIEELLLVRSNHARENSLPFEPVACDFGLESMLYSPLETILQFAPKDPYSHSDVNDEALPSVLRKSLQIKWVLELLKKDDLIMDPQTLILDVGGGQGDLSLNLAASYPDNTIICIDKNRSSLSVGNQRSVAFGIQNVAFCDMDIGLFANASFVDAQTLLQEKTDRDLNHITRVLLVGLHACGGLSDALLSLCSKWRASLICCTCCFGKHKTLRDSFLAENKWWGQPSNDAKRLTQLCDTHGSTEYPRAMKLVNNLRLRFVISSLTSDYSCIAQLLVFPKAWSPKNQVLCIQAG